MRACIFDLDGTLTDTLESLTFSVNESLRRMGLPPISSKQCESYVGNGARVLMQLALEAAGDAGASRLEEGMEVYGQVFGANCTYHVKPYKGILKLLDALRERSVKLAVLSNKPHLQTVYVVETVFGKGAFGWIQGQTEDIPKKPDPAGVYRLLQEMGVSKTECLYIGDSEVDIATGIAAGIATVGVEWGFRDRKVLVDAGAEAIISTPDQLLQFLS